MMAKKDIIIKHYKDIIERRKFDEYDVQGLLILTRFEYANNYPYLKEMADLVAHNKRDRGIVHKSISNAIINNYLKDKNNKIIDYSGFEEVELERQFANFLNDLNIHYDSDILRELIACLLSSAQDSEYEKNNTVIATMKLFIDLYNKKLVLYSIESNSDNNPVVFASLDIDCIQEEKQFFINSGIELKRKGKDLFIKYKGRYICKV